MATKSIVKTIVIKDKETAERFIINPITILRTLADCTIIKNKSPFSIAVQTIETKDDKIKRIRNIYTCT